MTHHIAKPMHGQKRLQSCNRRGFFGGFTLKAFAAAVLACLFTAPVCLATTYTVTNTNSSGAGSLSQAVSNANSSAGSTIAFAPGLTGTFPPGVSVSLTKATTISNLGNANTLTLDYIAASNGWGFYSSNALSFDAISSGASLSVTSSGGFAILTQSDTNLTLGSIASGATLNARSTTSNARTLASGPSANITITNGMAGALTATANNTALAIVPGTGGSLTIGGALSGSVYAETTSGATATAMSAGAITLNSVAAPGAITAKSISTVATGVSAGTGGLTVTGGMAGSIAATATNYAYAINSAGAVTIGGPLSGSLSAAATTGFRSYGILSTGNTSINGISGTISATAGLHTAVGISSGGTLDGGTLDGGTPTTPLSISGSVSAQAKGLAVAVASVGAMNINVSGTLSGVDTFGTSLGYAIRAGKDNGGGGWTTGNANNLVTLSTGANLVGKVDLGTGTNTLTLVGTGSSSNSFAGVTSLVAGNGTTSTNWTFTSPAANASTFGNLNVKASASLTLNENVTITSNTLNDGALVFNLGGGKTYNGVISGAGLVTKSGTGTLVLGGANTYTGNTSIMSGTLKAGAAGALSSASAVEFSPTATTTLDLNNTNQTVKGLSGGGSISGPTVTSVGTVALGSGNLTIAGASDTYYGVISGTGGVIKNGAGSQALSGANTYSGGTTFTAGYMCISNDNNLGTGNLTFNNGGLAITADVTTSKTIALAADGTLHTGAYNLTLNGAVTGGGTLTKNGTGTLTLNNTGNTYSGTTILNAGTLKTDVSHSLSANSTLYFSDTAATTLDINGTTQTVKALSGGGSSTSALGETRIGTGTLTVNTAGTNYSYYGTVSGSGGFIKAGSGVLSLYGNSASFSGLATIAGGNVMISQDTALGAHSTVKLSGTGTLLGALANLTLTQDIQLAMTTGGGFFNTNGHDVTISGNITGVSTGPSVSLFTKIGAGTLTLSGNNTYTGGTTVNTGTLSIAGSLASDSIAVAPGAAVDFNTATNTTYAGAISGAGDVTKSGTATVTLSGNNTYTGATTVNAGTLSIAGSLASNSIAVAPGAAVDFNTAANTTYAGAVSGAGGLSKSGAATLTLSGNNTYTGATTVNAGTLSVAGPIASSSVAIASGALFDLNPTADTNFSATLAGAGSFSKSGNATLTLSGANSYTGTTRINGGVLKLTAHNALPTATAVILADTPGAALDVNGYAQTLAGLTGGGPSGGNVRLGAGSLTVENHTDNVFGGNISGSGSFSKSGSAALTLSGNTTYTGSTSVSAGMLNITGALTSTDITVNSGAALNLTQPYGQTGPVKVNGTLTAPSLNILSGTLSGSGIVAANVTNTGGIVSPGNSPGTLTIQGNYTHNGGTLFMEVTPTAYDRLIVTGTATINGGLLRVAIAPGTYAAGQTCVFITSSGGIYGAFGAIQLDNPSPFLTFTVHQDGVWGAFEGPSSAAATVARLPYTIAAANRNAWSAALGLTAAAALNYPAMSQIVSRMDFSSLPAVSASLDQMSPEPYSAFNETAFSALRLFSNTIRDRIYALHSWPDSPRAELSWLDPQKLPGLAATGGVSGTAMPGRKRSSPADRAFELYVKPIGQMQTFGQSSMRTGFRAATFGLIAGADTAINNNLRLGAQIGYARTDLNFLDTGRSRGNADYLQGGIYASFAKGGFHASALVQGAMAWNQLHRKFTLADITRAPLGAYTSFAFGACASTGYDFTFDTLQIGPVATLDYGFVSNPGFRETKAGDIGLKVASNSASSLKSGLGLKASAQVKINNKLTLTPDVSVRWEHEFLRNSSRINASFTGAPGAVFQARTAKPSRDGVSLDAGLTLTIKDTTKVFVRYSGQLTGAGGQTHAGAVGLRFEF